MAAQQQDLTVEGGPPLNEAFSPAGIHAVNGMLAEPRALYVGRLMQKHFEVCLDPVLVAAQAVAFNGTGGLALHQLEDMMSGWRTTTPSSRPTSSTPTSIRRAWWTLPRWSSRTRACASSGLFVARTGACRRTATSTSKEVEAEVVEYLHRHKRTHTHSRVLFTRGFVLGLVKVLSLRV